MIVAARNIGLIVSIIILTTAALAAPGDRPPRPATRPSFTHTLVLHNDAGDNKGQPPRHFGLYLPDDWQTTGTAGKRQYDDRYDPRGMSPDEPMLDDLEITHDADGTVHFRWVGVTDAFFELTVHAVDATHFEGTWSGGAAFGPEGRSISSSGKAVMAVFPHPGTRPSR